MSQNEDFLNLYLSLKSEIDKKLDAYLFNNESILDGMVKSIQYAVGGGKRVRAVFTFLVGQMYNAPKEKLMAPACAMEMVHASSLIMDDLPYMDNAELRRGKPANHLVFGRDVALCSSVALLSRASEIILEDASLSDAEKLECTKVLNRSFGADGLAAGQFVDLKLKHKQVEMKVLEFINERKTAALFSAAGEVAVIVGGGSDNEKKMIRDYANNLGFTFQIIDDILDIKGDEKVVGKDLDKDKMNFAKLVGLDEAQNYAKMYMQKAERTLEHWGTKSKHLNFFGKYLLERAK